jgi:hypothetical protein
MGDGRPIRPKAPDGIMRTDAAKVGYGGNLYVKGSPGSGATKVSGHRRTNRRGAHQEGINFLLLCVENTSVKCVTRSFVAASRPIMGELRQLKRVLDYLGLQLSSEWLPSILNKYADAISQRFKAVDEAIRRTLRHSVVTVMHGPPDSFTWRPLGEHPVFLRRQCYQELAAAWIKSEMRLLCPPTDLTGAVMRKLRLTGDPEVLLVHDWPRQSWYRPALDISTTA